MIENENEIVDAKNFEEAQRGSLDPMEKEEREAAKANAKKAKSKEYVVTRALKCDGKSFKRGDFFEGKVYANLLEGKNPALITKKEYDER